MALLRAHIIGVVISVGLVIYSLAIFVAIRQKSKKRVKARRNKK